MTTKSTTQPEPTKTRPRSPQHQAATAVIDLEKLDAAIAKHKDGLAEKERAKKALVESLPANVQALVTAMQTAGRGK